MNSDSFQLKPGQAILEHCGRKFQVRVCSPDSKEREIGPIGRIGGKRLLSLLADVGDFECFNVKKTGKIIKLSKP